MKRSILSALVIVVVSALWSAAQSVVPQTPPGEEQTIAPPPAVPTPAPPVDPAAPPEPTPDELNTLAIVAAINGGEVTDDVVRLPVGKLLTLTLRGGELEKTPRPATWCLSRQTSDVSIYPADGHHVTFTAPVEKQGAYLFIAAVSALEPSERPLVAMRWVVVGQMPQPPPVVEPDRPDVPKPDAPPAPTPSTNPVPISEPGLRVMMLYEASEGMPDAFASAEVAEYLHAKLAKGKDGKTPEWRRQDDDQPIAGDFETMEKLRAAAPADCKKAIFPGGYIVITNGRDGYAGPSPEDPAELLALCKKYGG